MKFTFSGCATLFVGLLAIIFQAVPAKGDGQHPPGAWIATSGGRLWLEREGHGRKEEAPLLLIAGGPGLAHDYFHPYFSGLAANHPILYYDASGRGRSPGAPPYSFARDVKDLDDLRVSLKLQRWSLIGHSFGGMVAIAYALEHPSQVDRLILIGTHWSSDDWQASNNAAHARLQKERPDLWKHIQQLRARGLRSQFLGQVYQLPVGYYFYDVAKAAEVGSALVINDFVYYGIAGSDADFVLGGDLRRLDFRRSIKNLRIPVLVLGGRHDQIVPPAETLAVKSYLPKAEVFLLERSGHYPFIEEQEKTLSLIDRFLRKSSGQQPGGG